MGFQPLQAGGGGGVNEICGHPAANGRNDGPVVRATGLILRTGGHRQPPAIEYGGCWLARAVGGSMASGLPSLPGASALGTILGTASIVSASTNRRPRMRYQVYGSCLGLTIDHHDRT